MFALLCFFFFKQKTAYEMRISDWSSDVCSSDLVRAEPASNSVRPELVEGLFFSLAPQRKNGASTSSARTGLGSSLFFHLQRAAADLVEFHRLEERRSEEHTSELQSLMRISYAVFCLNKKKTKNDKATYEG